MNINDLDMSQLPDTVEMEVFVEIEPHIGNVTTSTVSMAKYGYIPLGTSTVSVPVPKDSNPVALMVQALDAEADKIQAEAGVKLQAIKEQKAQLLALTWQPAQNGDAQDHELDGSDDE